jgi:hypothetical protein
MMDHALLRLTCFLNRFSTMQRVRKAFRDVAPATWTSSITLYEKDPSAAQSIWGKVAIRYFGRNALSIVQDVDAYVARYDSGEISHTYWAVCRP